MPSYLVLARKYRPQKFSDVVGQDHVIRTLGNSILKGRVAHAFLFCGVRGVGKTTVARILAKALNCLDRPDTEPDPCCACASCLDIASGAAVDVQEIDGASHTSVENIREINDNIRYPPISSQYKVIIIDEVHMISMNAFNALLKTLEEPPRHAKFIFATTEYRKVPATINSRCQRFNFRTISLTDIVGGMTRILEKESITAEPGALVTIAREAQGSFRDALSLLDQVIAAGPDHLTEELVANTLGTAGRDVLSSFVTAVLNRDASAALCAVQEVFRQGQDPEQFLIDLVQYVRNLALAKSLRPESRIAIDIPQTEWDELDEIAGSASAEDLQNVFLALMRNETDVRRATNPWIAVEMLALRLALMPGVVDLAQLLKSVELGSAPRPIAPQQAPRPAPAPAVTRKKPVVVVSHDQKPPTTAEQSPITASPEPPATPSTAKTPEEAWDELLAGLDDPMLKSLFAGQAELRSFKDGEAEILFSNNFFCKQFKHKLDSNTGFRDLVRRAFNNAVIRTHVGGETTGSAAKPAFVAEKENDTDLARALKNEALEHKLVRALLEEFEGSSVLEINVLAKSELKRHTPPHD